MRLRHAASTAITLALVMLVTASASQQRRPAAERLPAARFDVTPPSARVSGEPGRLALRPAPCRDVRTTGLRRRIIDIALQEWAYFGFIVVDQTEEEDEAEPRLPWPARRRGLPPEEAARVATSIAGYWAVTPEAQWILSQQNEAWNGPDGVGARWRYPWSAAFVSWVMCESGLGSSARFRRAIGHYQYIDQAIRARDTRDPAPAYEAYDAGEAAVAPGDLLCTARRPAYRTLAERRKQLGTGARTHCDIVIDVDETANRYLAIGGNVRAAVSLKIIPAVRQNTGLRPARLTEGGRTVFAHLRLRADPVNPGALRTSVVVRAMACAADGSAGHSVLTHVLPAVSSTCGD